MKLIETRVSEIRPGDLWLYDGAWVAVNDIVVNHPDDRVEIDYTDDGEADFANPRGNEIVVVKRADADHPMRPEAVHMLASYRVVADYGDPSLIEDTADEMSAFVMALLDITPTEVEAAVQAES